MSSSTARTLFRTLAILVVVMLMLAPAVGGLGMAAPPDGNENAQGGPKVDVTKAPPPGQEKKDATQAPSPGQEKKDATQAPPPGQENKDNPGVGQKPEATESPAGTGRIAVFKFMCDRVGKQDVCNGRDTSLSDYNIDFDVRAGANNISGSDIEETITVRLSDNANGQGNTGNGSQGRSVGGLLPANETYTVCEVEVAYKSGEDDVPLNAFPRPTRGQGGSSGGVNQHQTGSDGSAGDNCITVTLMPGTAELKFLNTKDVPGVVTTPTPAVTPTPRDDDDDDDDDNGGGNGGTPTAESTPVPTAVTTVVTPAPVVLAQTPAVPTPAPVVAAATPPVTILPAAGSGGMALTALPLSLLLANLLGMLGMAVYAISRRLR